MTEEERAACADEVAGEIVKRIAIEERIAKLEQRREADRLDFCRVIGERDRAQVDLLHIKMAVFGEHCDYGSKTWQETVAEIERIKADARRYRYIRDCLSRCNPKMDGQHSYHLGHVWHGRGPTFDEAIDRDAEFCGYKEPKT
jgi:hypothetical protein